MAANEKGEDKWGRSQPEATVNTKCLFFLDVGRFPRYSPDKIFKLKVTSVRSKVKSRSDHDVAHLHLLTNVPTKYEIPTPYGF